ncbi:MAG: adenylate/guanylate cyclase domain-containing protein [Alphaproteobacteria bacterium]
MIRRLYLITGLVLFGYLSSHLLNHTLGLVSLEALEAGRAAFLLLWRNPPMTLLFYGALALHVGLALRSLYRRRRLRMPAWEAAQLVLGLAIPPLLLLHVLATRFAHEVLGAEDSYVYVILAIFVFDPVMGVKQAAALLVAWLHACIGLHFWLRIRPWYAAVQPYAFAAALLLPAFALAGFLAAGREVARLAADPDWLAAALTRARVPDAESAAWLYDLQAQALFAMAGVFGLVLVARALRDWRDRRHGVFQVTYPEGRRVRVTAGSTLLEASRGAGIPHASVCGGRGRCSTCRIRVGAGRDKLPPPSEAEARVLARIGAAPNTRLACQTRPVADVEIAPLLAATTGPRQARASQRHQQGEEREVAVLFADLRGFTALAEARLPYDVVFVLNRYFAAMGAAVEESGGRIDKFIGDGVMALFGVDRDVETGCRDALAAARRMIERLGELNKALENDLDRPLRIGIGIHSGPVILGEMGYGRATAMTAIGDSVNTASRLEALTKEFKAELVLSEPVATRAGLDFGAFPRHEIELRGRAGQLAVFVVGDTRLLP